MTLRTSLEAVLRHHHLTAARDGTIFHGGAGRPSKYQALVDDLLACTNQAWVSSLPSAPPRREGMSLWLMRILLAQYLLLAVISVWETRLWQGCYWVGAGLITVALLGMR